MMIAVIIIAKLTGQGEELRGSRSLKFITSRFITSNGAHLREARGPIIKSFNRMSLAWVPGLLTGYEAKKYARKRVKREERKRAAPHRLHVTAGLYRVSSRPRLATYPLEGLMEDFSREKCRIYQTPYAPARKKSSCQKNGRTVITPM